MADLHHTKESSASRAIVSWKIGSEEFVEPLSSGRHLIGNSSFATIKIDSGLSICGYLSLEAEGGFLKCTSDQPPLYVENRLLKAGESIVIGDCIEFFVGRHPVFVSMQSKKSAATMKKSESSQKKMSPDAIRLQISKELLSQLNLSGISLENIDSDATKEAAQFKLKKLISDFSLPEDFPYTAQELESQIYNEVLGLGPLEPFLEDKNITEIMVNRRDQIFIERNGQLEQSPVNFSSDQALINIIDRIVSTVGRRIDQSSPIVDARLLDGSRVNAIIPPLAIKGPSLTIRRFSSTPIRMADLVSWGSLTEEMSQFLEAMVLNHKNMIISGGTGSGKTTLLNAISNFIPEKERIVTVEDAAELQLQQEHVISLETRPANLEGRGAVTIRDLVKNTLRMRPDRIIVGECRSGEALDMLQAMNTGHDGSMTTAHANTPEDLLRRLETMVLMAGMELPLRAIREQVVSAITIIVQQTRKKDGKRLVTEISWARSLSKETGEYEVLPLFKMSPQGNIELMNEHLEQLWIEEEISCSAADTCGSLTKNKSKGAK